MRRVAVDSGPLSGGDSVRGIGVYARELLSEFGMVGVDVWKTDVVKYDVIHFTKFHPFFISLPFKKPPKTKFILTIYDLIPLIYPKHYPPGIRGQIKWMLNKFLIESRIDAIITISETSKKDICRYINIDPKKVYVTYLAAPKIFKKLTNQNVLTPVKEKFSLPEKFALYLGDLNYNKNIPNLVKACELAKIPLVMVGKQIEEIGRIDLNHSELRHLKKVDFSKTIKLGYISYEDLVGVMNLASVYVQPSLYEGFGIPVVEALSCETPLAVSKNQCHVEILGDDFEYADPTDPKDLARCILNPNRGKKPPREYSWTNTARATKKIYEKV